MIKVKTFKFNEKDLQLLEDLKRLTNINSEAALVRYSLAYCLRLIKGNFEPEQPKLGKELEEVFIYEGWSLVSGGNDPEKGDWKRIRENPSPEKKFLKDKVLWYGDEGFYYF